MIQLCRGCSPALDDRRGRRVRAPSLAEIVDKSAFTGCVGYAHPTDAPDDRLDPSQGLPALAIRKGGGRRRQKPQGDPGRVAEAPFPPVMISGRPRGSLDALAASTAMWERGRPAASTPLRASRPCAPFGLGLRPRG